MDYYKDNSMEYFRQKYLKSAEEDYRRASRHRTAAAVADFATNLLSAVGRSKGLRYDITGRQLTGSTNSAYNNAQERYRKAMIDYKGKIAASNFLYPSARERQNTLTSYTAQQQSSSGGKASDTLPQSQRVSDVKYYSGGVPWYRNDIES